MTKIADENEMAPRSCPGEGARRDDLGSPCGAYRERPAWLSAYDRLAARDRAHRKLAVRRLQDAFDDEE